MNVLVSAYACLPDRGSEPGAGWEIAKAVAHRHDVVLLTQDQHANEIRQAMVNHGVCCTVVGIRGLNLLRSFVGRLGLGHLDYLIWQRHAYVEAKKHAHWADIAHHVTYANDWLPAAVHNLKGVGVVWGPVGGIASFPWRLARFFSLSGAIHELAREAVTRSVRVFTARLVRRNHVTVIAMNKGTAERFRKLGVPVIVEPHVALPPIASMPSAQKSVDGERQIVFVARLVSWKGPYLALATLARLPPEWHLTFYGSGPEAPRVTKQVEKLGLGDRVRFAGHIPLHEVRAQIATADVLLFPSTHDSASFAVAEAVNLGCPVVCLDAGGPPLLIEDTGGAAVKPDRHAPERLAEAVLVATRSPRNDRWGAGRLGDLIDAWYAAALARDL